MSDKAGKSPETEEEMYEVFLELFDGIAPETSDEIDMFLRENGYNPDELTESAKNIFKEVLEASPLDWRNRARQEIEVTKTTIRQSEPKPESNRRQIIAEIEAIQQKRSAAVAAHFRNLDLNNVSTEELADMLADLEYLVSQDTQQDE